MEPQNGLLWMDIFRNVIEFWHVSKILEYGRFLNEYLWVN